MLRRYRQAVVDFMKTGLTPREIAFGIALGNFVGILPFLGLHTVMALGLAYLLRLNMGIVFLGTQVSNPISFPFILVVSAQIGNLLLRGNFLDIQLTTDLDVLKTYLWPTMLGSIVLGGSVGALSYGLTLRFARRLRQ